MTVTKIAPSADAELSRFMYRLSSLEGLGLVRILCKVRLCMAFTRNRCIRRSGLSMRSARVVSCGGAIVDGTSGGPADEEDDEEEDDDEEDEEEEDDEKEEVCSVGGVMVGGASLGSTSSTT